MQAPVSMLKGLGGKGNTTLVLGLLVGLALMAMIKNSTPSPTTYKPPI
jgi:hypothetical protein